jgi:hypothetical protein
VLQSVVASTIQQQSLLPSPPRCAPPPGDVATEQSVVAAMIQQHPSAWGAFGALLTASLHPVVATMIQQHEALSLPPRPPPDCCALVVQSVVARTIQQQLAESAPTPPPPPPLDAIVVQSVVATMIQQHESLGGCGALICKVPPFPPFR